MLELKNVSKYFSVESKLLRTRIGTVAAVDDVSFVIQPGEIVGLVGESGSGKTTIAKLITRLYNPDRGSIVVDKKHLESYSSKKLAAKIQIIFQDPFASLNPKLSIGTILEEAVCISMRIHAEPLNTAAVREKVRELLVTVGLPDNIMDNYPHQFSGGQRQRVAVARALAYKPRLIIADEPVSSLDVSTQAQIINLFTGLREQFGLSYLFISHDIRLVAYLCDRIIVMQNGRIVERGIPSRILQSPSDPYTKRLIASITG